MELHSWRSVCSLVLMLMALVPRVGWSQERGFSYKIVWNDPVVVHPTKVLLSPLNGHLFVALENGRIFDATLNSNFQVTSYAAIDVIYNYNGAGAGRQVTGMVFDASGNLFVSHSDPRIDIPSGSPLRGVITKLSAAGYNNPALAVDIVTNLPRSMRDHSTNGLAFDDAGNLFAAQGGMTNAGLASDYFHWAAEEELSGSILLIDQAGHSASTYATGFRNPYGLLWHSGYHKLYASDNGPNSPAGDKTDPNCGDGGTVDQPDKLAWVQAGHYYGHPNPWRHDHRSATTECTFNGGDAPIHWYGTNPYNVTYGHTSSDGIAEYKSAALPGLTNWIITANYANSLDVFGKVNNLVAVRLYSNGQAAAVDERTIWSGLVNPVDVAVRASDGAIFVAELGASRISVVRVVHAPAIDLNADLRSDLGIFRPSSGEWYIRDSATGSTSYFQYWGLPGDIAVAIDYDGDGKTDIGSYRPSNGYWALRTSTTNYSFSYYVYLPNLQPSPVSTDIPVPADYDGDGLVDLAVFRPSTGEWYWRSSATGLVSMFQYWGLPGDLAVPIDYDGDGKADLANYRPSDGTWHIRISSNGYSFDNSVNFQWGVAGDIPAVADYDGDGRSDVAIFRPSTGEWWVLPSSTGGYIVYQYWGLPGDLPRPLDYDGDGKADLCLYRPSDSSWHLLLSSTGYSFSSTVNLSALQPSPVSTDQALGRF
jgi:glucose/arabinose dehydrogenase